MNQSELDAMIREHGFGSPRADFTGRTLHDLDISHQDLTGAIFDGLTVCRCDFSNTNLSKITAHGIHFMDCNFTNASLKDAYLSGARYTLNTFSNTDLWNVAGDGVYIISLQLGGKNVCYTSELLQINCLQFDLKTIWWMDDKEVMSYIKAHDAKEKEEMARWWHKWKYQIYQIVNMQQAKPVNSPK